MRKPLALLCLAALLVTAIVLPVTGWVVAALPVTLTLGIVAAPRLGRCFLPPPAAIGRSLAFVAALPFRGPPASLPVSKRFPGHARKEESWPASDWLEEGIGWRRSFST
jgi:hypothetical protein